MKTLYKKLLFLVLLFPLSMLAQTSVSGVVLDSKTNQPLPGVNVNVQKSTNGTSTDFDGKFRINKVKSGDVIVFSFIGYKEETVTYSSQDMLKVSLVEESNKLQEVVIQTGYGSVKKKDATGAIEVITAKDFNQGANFNAEGLLTGRVAGVVVTAGGRPGDGAAIRIRGGSSVGASNAPLIVLDGLPLDSGSEGNGVISSLNPNDIESFSILKDASATAIYGSRASNGVILITTKKGAKGELKASFGTNFTYNTIAKKQSTLSGDDFRSLVNDPANITRYNISAQNRSRLGTANTNWQDAIFSNTVSIENNLSLRGSLWNVLPTLFSFGHTNIPGILNTSQFDRTNAALRLNPSFFDNHLKIAVNLNFSSEYNRFANEGAISNAIAFDPTQPVYDAQSPLGGYFEWYNVTGGVVNYTLPGLLTQSTANPVSLLNERRNAKTNNRYYGNIQIDYKFHFLPALKGTVNFGLDNQAAIFKDETSANSRSRKIFFNQNVGVLNEGWNRRQNQLFDGYLNYTKKIGVVNVDVTAGYSYQNLERNGYFTGDYYATPYVPTYTKAPKVNLQGYFGKANFGFYDKYLVTLNYRRDATSRFSPSKRWGNFPGGAVGWVVSKESFLKDSKSITNLKFRAGYGITGQQEIGADYAYIPSYVLSNVNAQYQFGNTLFTTSRPNPYNEDLKWEETATTNLGLDFELFKKVNGTIDVYRKETKDLIDFVVYPDGSNLSNQGFRNFGNLRAEGIELGLNFDIIKKQNLNWKVNFNASYQNRKITALASDGTPGFVGNLVGGIQGGVGNNIQIQSTGYAPNAFYVFEQVYGTNGNPLEGVYVDRNSDGVIDNNDRYQYKKPYADYTFGFLSNINYKKFDLSMSWRGSLGNYMYDNASSVRGYANQSVGQSSPYLNNFSQSALDTGFINEGNGRYFSDYYIKDASFIKLDNISIGYNVSHPFGANTSARFNLGVQNALIITKYKGLDPEVFSGIDNVIYPRARMFVAGFNVNF